MTDFNPNLDLAYQFAPSIRPGDTGHPRLIIRLRSVPTRKHFDPEQVIIPVFSKEGNGDPLKITHPWHTPGFLRAYPGRVAMRDRMGKTVEAFTFGGEMKVSGDQDNTTCDITSPAPILELTGADSINELLTEEVEILLAGLYAAWEGDPESLELRLQALSPLAFYAGCLFSLKGKFERYPIVEGGMMAKLAQHVRSELHNLQERSGSPIPTKKLEELISSL